MIQELLGGSATLIAAERKTSTTNSSSSGGGRVLLLPHTTPLLSPCSLIPSSSPCPPSTTTAPSTPTTNTPTSATSSNSENQNMRCPRCDSSNTKFCYYNNYNLTQPRHFCKTCRRYWTKGGALRNVPIGGGCRKNKNGSSSGLSSSAAGKTSPAATMLKTVASVLGRSSISSGLGPGFDHHELPSVGPILWGSPQNSHILALLRASQNQNPNPNPSSMSLNAVMAKDEGNNNLMGSQAHHMVTDPLAVLDPPPALGGYDSPGQVPSLGLCSSVWTNNQDQDQSQQTNGGFLLGEYQASNGIQELYHKLRATSSVNYDGSDNNSPVFLGNMVSSSSSYSISNISESASSVSGAEPGYWNPTLSWSDLPTTNGAYP